VALGAGLALEAVGTTLFVIVVLQGLGRIERLVERQSTVSRVLIHARPDPSPLEDLETVVRRAGVDNGVGQVMVDHAMIERFMTPLHIGYSVSGSLEFGAHPDKPTKPAT